MKIRILPSAMKDLKRGKRFYEEQGEGLGQYFMDSLFADIESLALYGGIHSVRWGYHRLLAKRFPYAAYYRVQDNLVEVWRVLDCRKHPRWIERSLTGH